MAVGSYVDGNNIYSDNSGNCGAGDDNDNYHLRGENVFLVPPLQTAISHPFVKVFHHDIDIIWQFKTYVRLATTGKGFFSAMHIC